MNTSKAADPVRAPALERSRFAQRLRRVVRGEVRFDAISRGRYAGDASMHRVDPLGVLVPADETDVVAAIELAAEMRVPMIPRGAGTGLAGQSVGEGLVIDSSRSLNRIVAFDAAERIVAVQPGVVLAQLDAFLAPHGLWFPVDPGSAGQATLGGMVGCNAAGPRSLAHGHTVHHVVGIDAVLPDGTQEFFGPFGARASRPMGSARTGAMVSRLFELGARERAEIERVWPRVPRRAGGYNLDVFHPVGDRRYTDDGSVNLAHLLAGSEGTLAHFQRLYLKLEPRPRHRALAVVRVPAIEAVFRALDLLLRRAPTAIELFDRPTVDRARRVLRDAGVPEVAIPPDGGAVLIVEFVDEVPDALRARSRQLEADLADLAPGADCALLFDEQAQQAVWEIRAAAMRAARLAAGPDTRVPLGVVDDCAVPLEHLGDFFERCSDAMRRLGVRATWSGSIGVGTLVPAPMLDPRDPQTPALLQALSDEIAGIVRRLRGTFRSALGDPPPGAARAGWQYEPRLERAFDEVKALFDPEGLMNPGRIVRPKQMPNVSEKTNIRKTEAILTVLADSSACNGCGHCRGTAVGTMCPSYRVTRSEVHSPRGRVNALRAAGADVADAATSAALRASMALCVGCKACRDECPAGIDLRWRKVELLSKSWRSGGRSLRDRLLAGYPRRAPIASRLAWLTGLRDSVPGMRRLGERLLGIPARRSLPRWAPETFLRGLARAERTGTGRVEVAATRADPRHGNSPSAVGEEARGGPALRSAREVVMLADCAGNYHAPDDLRAAKRVLEAAGWRVHVATPVRGRPLCCGRTWLDAGAIDEARDEARRTIAALTPFVEHGIDVIGLEPGCLLTLRDEYLRLGLGEAAGRLAARALLFEEFVAREHAAGRFELTLGPVRFRRALVHPHCHQRAFGAVAPILSVLALVPGLEVELLDAGCCGMTGSFGLEAEHFEISMRMAELALLPAVREAGVDTVVLADGGGCRHQIRDGTSRDAMHVAALMAEALDAAAADRGLRCRPEPAGG